MPPVCSNPNASDSREGCSAESLPHGPNLKRKNISLLHTVYLSYYSVISSSFRNRKTPKLMQTFLFFFILLSYYCSFCPCLFMSYITPLFFYLIAILLTKYRLKRIGLENTIASCQNSPISP